MLITETFKWRHKVALRLMMLHADKFCFPYFEPLQAWHRLGMHPNDEHWKIQDYRWTTQPICCLTCGHVYWHFLFLGRILIQECSNCKPADLQRPYRIDEWHINEYARYFGVPAWWVQQLIGEILEDNYGRKINAAISQQQTTAPLLPETVPAVPPVATSTGA